MKVDFSHQIWFHLNRARQQRKQEPGAHLPIWTPAFPTRRVVIGSPGSQFYVTPSRESGQEPQFGIG